MNKNDLNASNDEFYEAEKIVSEAPVNSLKPLKKLVRTDRIRENAPVNKEYHGRYEAEAPREEYHGRYEAETPQERYHGRYEAEAPQEGYHGRYEAEAPQEGYHGRYEAEAPQEGYHGRYEAEASQEGYHGRYEAEAPQEECYDEYQAPAYENSRPVFQGATDTEGVVPMKPEKKTVQNALVKVSAIVISLILIILLILNMPIIAYNKEGQPLENISIITFVKRWQPLNSEGNLKSNDHINFNVNADIVNDEFNDGLDLPQTIEGQYSVLFLGFDESGTLIDVNWIFQFDIAAGKVNVLQIPRDTFMPAYGGVTGKFNSVYGSGNSDAKPIQRVVDAVQENFGIPIDAYVTTHCYDIVDMVDLVGGIPINLEEGIMYEADKIIPAGESVLTGQQAEWFVRYRHGFSEGDIGRVKNQRKFLAAAMEKMLGIYANEGRMKFYGYLKEIYENEYIHTDLSLEDISMIADFASNISLENVQVNMVPGEGAWYYPNGTDKQSVWSVHKQATIDMLNEYFRPYQNDMTVDESALVELVTNYLTTGNDDTGDTLQELQDGAEPGQNKADDETAE